MSSSFGRVLMSRFQMRGRHVLRPILRCFANSAAPTNYLTEVLNSSVYELARETPLDFIPDLSDKVLNQVYFKREDMQLTFAANLRGAYHKLRSLSSAEASRGVVALGSNRSCEGVAKSAKTLGIDATVVVPAGTSRQQVTKLENLKANVIPGGTTFEESLTLAKRIAERDSRILIHPFDDPLVIAGAGTIGAEILRQRAASPLDVIFCVAGGGGILGGVAAFVKQVRPSVRVIGVETEGATPLSASLQTGMRVSLRSADVGQFADASASIGRENFSLCRQFVDDTISVSTDDICAAIRDCFDSTRVLLDPSGALGIAGLKKWARQSCVQGKTLIAINTSAGTEFNKLRFISERSDDSEYFVAVTIPDRPGAFHRLYKVIDPRNVTEFSYRATPTYSMKDKDYSMSMDGVPAIEAFIYLSFQADSRADAESVFEELRKNDFRVRDLSGNELAKTHARHLVGGRAAVPHERLLRFQFPDRPGALKKFLACLAQGIHFDFHRVEPWNVSLFHYRSHGDDVGSVLVGIQVPPDFEENFEVFLSDLGYSYVEETSNVVYQDFLR